MSEKHETTCTDEIVRGHRGTTWKCTCGAGGSWWVRDGSAEADAYYHRLARVPGLAEAEAKRKAEWLAKEEKRLEEYRAGSEARRLKAEAAKQEAERVAAGMDLAEDFEYLAEDHPDCKFELSGSHGCSCHVHPPCGRCEACPSHNPEAWKEKS